MIGGILKSYPNFTLDYVLHDLSYQNLVLLSSIIPSYDFDKDKKGKKTPKGKSPQPGNAGGLKGLFATLKGAK